MDGFYFIGWDKPYTTITADVDIVAVYGENKFWTVTYYDEDGTTKLGEETVADGMSAQGNPVSKDGYNFLGWFDMSDNPANFAHVSADMSVKAKWEKIILYFKVTLKAEHGKIAVVETGIDLTKVQENTVLHFTATPNEGYQFVEWKNYDPDKGLTVTEDITVTAVFEEIPPATYKVTLEAEHGTIEVVETGINLNKVVANTVLHFTATPDKGYLFKEWVNYDPDKGLKVTKNITVTAVFEEEPQQGLNDIQDAEVRIQKVVHDGQVLILRDGHVYNVLGIEIQ